MAAEPARASALMQGLGRWLFHFAQPHCRIISLAKSGNPAIARFSCV